MSRRPFIPLYDLRQWRGDDPVDRVIAVNGIDTADRRCSFGVPAWISDKTAIETARQRGWKVAGIWRPK